MHFRKLKKIVENVDEKVGPGEKYLPVLTAIERATWAEMRSQFFNTGVNKTSLDLIEKVRFVNRKVLILYDKYFFYFYKSINYF